MTKTLTKADIVDHLVENTGIKSSKAKDIVDDFFEKMCQTLEDGESIKISGFGNFNLRDKKARPGRNPKTKQEATISARRVVTFKPGQKLQQRVLSIGTSI